MYKKKIFLKKLCCSLLAAAMLMLPAQAAGLVAENQISVVDKDSAKGEMTVAITYPALADEGSRVLVPVWTDNNGQDDIIWYRASLGTNGWEVTVNYKNHNQESGIYHLHFYGQDSNGNLKLLGGIRETLEYIPEQTPPSTPPAAANPKVEAAVSDGKATLTLSGASNLSENTAVYFPTWGQTDGQNDIVWYSGKYISPGTWQVTIDSTDHGENGVYITHAYARTSAGLTLVAHTNYEIKGKPTDTPSGGGSEPVIPPQEEAKMTISATKSSDGKYFTVDLKNYASKGKVYFAVWGSVDGQNDIIWHPAQNAGENLWTLTVNAADHKNESGTYIVHVYDVHAKAELVTHTTCSIVIEEEPPQEDVETTYSKDAIELTAKDSVAGTFTVTVKNVQCNKEIEKVSIVVWSNDGGQDDIIWYTAEQDGNDWTKTVDVKADHGNHRGRYHAHVYLRTKDNELFLLGGISPFMDWKTAQGIPGIDVSIWQGKIDWKQVKSVGVEFAMIRSSYGFEKTEETALDADVDVVDILDKENVDAASETKETRDTRPAGQIDANFIYNIQQAKANGVKVGVYHYSYAETVEEVLKEAELCLSAIRASGVSLDYPIAFDIEEASRFDVNEIENNNALIKAFCDAVEAAGYDAVVYGNPYLFDYFVDYNLVQNYGAWLAYWTYDDSGSFGDYGNVQLWQFSNEGSMDGIQAPVDLNVGFIN